MTEECDALLAALTTFHECPNLDEDGKWELAAWIERTSTDFTARNKVKLDADAQKAIAVACRRATNSVIAATERCHAGKPPRTD